MPPKPKPVRAIVGCGSLLYKLNKYIANILKVCVKDGNNNTKNSTTFSDYRNVSTENDK